MTTSEMHDQEGEGRYNGWKNYETWAVKLWLDNEQSSYDWATELAAECLGEQHERYDLAHALQSEIEDAMPDLGGTLWSDLLNAAFSDVDWYEIADAYLAEAREATEYAR